MLLKHFHNLFNNLKLNIKLQLAGKDSLDTDNGCLAYHFIKIENLRCHSDRKSQTEQLKRHIPVLFVLAFRMHTRHVMRKPVLPYANNKGADQPAHHHSLISAFVSLQIV